MLTHGSSSEEVRPKLFWFNYPPCAAAISVDPRSVLNQAEIKLKGPALALTAKAHSWLDRPGNRPNRKQGRLSRRHEAATVISSIMSLPGRKRRPQSRSFQDGNTSPAGLVPSRPAHHCTVDFFGCFMAATAQNICGSAENLVPRLRWGAPSSRE